MEVIRHLVNGRPYTPDEEPLAVAYSRQWLRDNAWNSNVGRLGKVVYNLAMEIAFDCYPSPYRDWPRYDSPERLKCGIVDLLQPMHRAFWKTRVYPCRIFYPGLFQWNMAFMNGLFDRNSECHRVYDS